MYQKLRSFFDLFHGHLDFINLKQLLFQSHLADCNQISYGALIGQRGQQFWI